MYSFDSRVRFSESDSEGKLSLESIVDYFQDCSTFQSEDLGVGVRPLQERGLVWVLSYWQIDIEERPRMGEAIQICTHPHEFKGAAGMRNFCLKNAKGKMVVRANSLWTLLNLRTRYPCRVPEEIASYYALEEKLPMEYAPRKVVIEGREEALEPLTVRSCHLDCNGHVNNGQYIRMAAAFLPSDHQVVRLRAEYRAQAYLGDSIYPYLYLNEKEEKRIITLCNERKEPYLIAEFMVTIQSRSM